VSGHPPAPKSAKEPGRYTVNRAVAEEFDRYIAAGDLDKTLARIAALEAQTLEHGGFVGMGL